MRCSGVGGLEAVEVLGGEGLEVGGFFAADDFGSGVDAGFQGIHGGGGLRREPSLPIVSVPFIGMSLDEIIPMAATFDALLEHLGRQ